jgi:hypothetical protein
VTRNGLLSAWIAFHFVAVTWSVLPRGELLDALDPVLGDYLDLVDQNQRWAMFAPVTGYDPVLVAEIRYPDGRRASEWGLHDPTRPPDLALRYDRMTKVQMVVQGRESKRYAPPYAAWVCRRHPGAESVRLFSRRYAHRGWKEALGRPDFERSFEDQEVLTAPCATP